MRDTLADSHARLRDFEAMGMKFHREADGRYTRRPTRGLDLARVLYPEGGGLEFCWRLRLALEQAGVALIDKLFVTGLLRHDGRIVGAIGLHGRSGETPRHQGTHHDRRHQRHRLPRRLRARHRRHRNAARL